MKLSRSIRKFVRLARTSRRQAFSRVDDELQSRTKAFIAASILQAQINSFTRLFRTIWTVSNERAFTARLIRWIRLLEHDDSLRTDFQQSFQSMMAELDSVSLLAEAGLPAHHGIISEGLRRFFHRYLPRAYGETDMSRLVVSLFSTPHDVERFLRLPAYVFERLLAVLWSPTKASPGVGIRMEKDLRQALCLMATRTAGRGVTEAMRERGGRTDVEDSPFYQLIFATEDLVRANAAAPAPHRATPWQGCAAQCREELDIVHRNMEDSGVSADLVLDLRSIEMTLTRMDLLVKSLAMPGSNDLPASANGLSHETSTRILLNELIAGRLEDKRVSSLLKQNLNLLARKTVERTGYSGQHYIALTNREYWHMWLAALGGGLLTVLTAAFKLRIVEQHYPLFIEGLFSSLNYSISFILLQVFGLALATKQPSATAAAFAGIVRNNRGYARRNKIADFTACITRTQLAAAIANVTAVCAGAVAFEHLWRAMFSQSYLEQKSAWHVYETLHPFASGTIVYAAVTGVLLWLAALIGGWCENFAVYHRIPAAVAQHPFGLHLGKRSMQRLSRWLEHNIGGWSTSVSLGFLLGFAPDVARFFGVPLDVRHVTLSTGTLALAAARYGTSSFGQHWFYYAVGGIGITFVLNLSVSFLIAAFVALRAYDVRSKEQLELLMFLIRTMIRSPLKFLIPIENSEEPSSAIPELLEKD